jgi:CBS-domain-containing membrane protein
MKRRPVETVMTKDVIAVTEETPYYEIVKILAERAIKAVPVIDAERRVVGIVSDADLLRKEEYKDRAEADPPLFEGRRHRTARAKAAATDAAGLMSAKVVCLTPDMPVPKAARILAEHGYKQAPVVDGEGRLVGIVTRSDLLRLFLRPDEDIRQEIVREVLFRGMWQDPARVHVHVDDGVVTLSGTLDAKSLIPVLVKLTTAVDGVIDVISDLSFDYDDTRPLVYPGA